VYTPSVFIKKSIVYSRYIGFPKNEIRVLQREDNTPEEIKDDKEQRAGEQQKPSNFVPLKDFSPIKWSEWDQIKRGEERVDKTHKHDDPS